MKTIRPARIASLTSTVAAVVGLTLPVLAFGMLLLLADDQHRLEVALREAPHKFAIAAGVYGAVALLCLARAPLAPRCTRLEIGPTDLTLHEGVLWKSSRTARLADVLRTEVLTGPMDRLTDTGTLLVHLRGGMGQMPVTVMVVRGIREPREVQRMILDRAEVAASDRTSHVGHRG